MRIAQVAPLQVAVPPRAYGGTERVIANLTEALVALGHDVTLCATGDSRTRAHLRAFVPKALGFEGINDPHAYHIALLTHVYHDAAQFDIIHSHLDYLTLPFIRQTATPTAITLHNRLDTPEETCVMRTYPDANYVSISDDQRYPLPDVHFAATVYHGVNVDEFPFYPDPGGYLAFVGRISPEKGPELAIEVAIRAGVPLKIAAKVDPKDRRYFRERIEPRLSHPLIEFLGPVGERRKRQLMGNALALLLPIDWPEPFGMVFIEALACGTPVLSRPRGAAPEVLRDGVTGFMRENEDELVAAVGLLAQVSRQGCRAYVKERFDTMRMARDYVRLYDSLTRNAQPLSAAAL
jgi:glycosyltransferase involved in cell wall biosynthesis